MVYLSKCNPHKIPIDRTFCIKHSLKGKDVKKQENKEIVHG